jgi:hypothetical protein
MKKTLLACLVLATTAWSWQPAQSASPVQLKQIFVDTAENSSVRGDAITIVFNQAMNRANWVDNRISHSAQTTPKAPAGYTQPASSQSARTAAYTGTWANLGGSAIYDAQDSSMVLLVPASLRSQLFTPGDSIEITAANTLTTAEGLLIDSTHLHQSSQAS